MQKFYNVEQFDNRLSECVEVICIGLGRMFVKLIEVLDNMRALDKVSVLADNNPELIGTQYTISSRQLDIVSIPSMMNLISPNSLIIISCMQYAEIIAQINSFSRLSSIDIICFPHIYALIKEKQSLNKKIPHNLRFSSSKLIPKTIHYCWFGKNPIPDRYRKWMESWKRYCPDYEIVEADRVGRPKETGEI